MRKILPWAAGSGFAIGHLTASARCTMVAFGHCTGCAGCVVALVSLVGWALVGGRDKKAERDTNA